MAVNSRYVITVTGTLTDVLGHSANQSSIISFNNGGAGTGRTITCRATGEFEQDVLALVN
jgi:hypothetical protein